MKSRATRRNLLLALLTLLAQWLPAAEAGSDSSRPFTALITRVEGQVTLTEPLDESEPRSAQTPIRRARPFQVLPPGAQVHVPAGGRLELVCASERWILLEGESTWTLSEAACRRGEPLPPGTHQGLTPRGGRLLRLDDMFTFQRATRPGVEQRLVPVLLSPRDTALLDPQPEIVWTTVPRALEYEVKLLEAQSSIARYAPEDIPCGVDDPRWPEVSVCRTPWPAELPALGPGRVAFLSIAARTRLTGAWKQEPEPSKLRLLGHEEAAIVERSLAELEGLPGSQIARLLLTAAVQAQHKLYAAAIASCRAALIAEDLPQARIALGDLLLTVELPDQAIRHFQAAGSGSDDPAIQAAAEFGLGRAHLDLHQAEEARGHFSQARHLYLELGLQEEAEAAANGMTKARVGAQIGSP